MKKFIIVLSIVLLSAGCSVSHPVVSVPASNNQLPSVGTVTTSPPPSPTLAPNGGGAATPTPKPSPVSLNIYQNAALGFKFLYLSYFASATAAQMKTTSACVPYGITPASCLVLKNQPYQQTNLGSAAVAISILGSKKAIGDCATFTSAELNGGQPSSPKQINGVVFVTAVSTDAGAGNFAEVHFNRAWHNNSCYQITETTRWAEAANFSPPRQEFDKTDVWNKLDSLTGSFYFTK